MRLTRRQWDAMDARGMFEPSAEPVVREIQQALDGLTLALPDSPDALRQWALAFTDEANGADALALGRHADPDVTMRRFHKGDRDALSRVAAALWRESERRKMSGSVAHPVA